MSSNFPLNKSQLDNLINDFPTPFYLYDEAAIRENMRKFTKAFSIFPVFREHFAVKACPNPYILKILAEEGCGADCSSLPELMLSEMAGIKGKKVIFTSNETPADEYQFAYDRGNIINFDDITHIDYFKKNIGKLPDTVCFRYNPGAEKQGCNSIIGKPEESKYGLTREQIFEAYKICKSEGVKHFGLHTMVASNELNPAFFVEPDKGHRGFQPDAQGLHCGPGAGQGRVLQLHGRQCLRLCEGARGGDRSVSAHYENRERQFPAIGHPGYHEAD